MAEIEVISSVSSASSSPSPMEGGAVSFNEKSFVSSTQLTQKDTSITISYTPTRTPPNHEPLMTPIHSRRFSAVSHNPLNKSDGFIPIMDLEDGTDKKLVGEVDGLLHMHNSRTSDNTAYGEAHRVENTCKDATCAFSMSKDFLKCSNCKLPIHYECSKLPQYQLYLFVKKTRKFTCEECVDLSSSDWPQVGPQVESTAETSSTAAIAAPPSAASISKADITLLFNNLEKNLVDVLHKQSIENQGLRDVINTKERDTLNKEKSATEKALSQIKRDKDALTRQVDELTKDKVLLQDQLKEKATEVEQKAKEVEQLLLVISLRDADMKDYKAMIKDFEDKLSAHGKKPASEQPKNTTQEETQVTANDDSGNIDNTGTASSNTGTASSNGSLSDKFKSPDILCITNSLGKDIDAGKIFAPKFTNKQVLSDKSIEGAISFVNTCDIQPKDAVVFHVIENSISVTSDNSEQVMDGVGELVTTAKNKWPNINIFLVEPIGRKFKDGLKTDFYVNTAQVVRQSLSNVVSNDFIIKTPLLHEVKFETFMQDWVHLKPRGMGALCLSYKKVVYKGLGISHDSSSFPESRIHRYRSPRPQRRDARFEDSQRFYPRDNRGDDLSKLMKNFEVGLRGYMKRY